MEDPVDTTTQDTTALRDYLEETRRDIQRVMESIQKARDEQVRGEKLLEQMRAEAQGLEYAIQRRSNAPLPAAEGPGLFDGVSAQEDDGPPSLADSDWKQMPRTRAVLRIVKLANSPVSPAEVRDGLRAVGRSDDYDRVSSTLAYLKKRGDVAQPTRGVYTAAGDGEEGATASA